MHRNPDKFHIIQIQGESEKSDTFYTPLTQRRGSRAWENRLHVVRRTKHLVSIEHCTVTHRAFGVKAYLKNNESMVKTRCLFRRRFSIHRNVSVPSKITINSWVLNFRETASAIRKRPLGRPRTLRTPENVNRVWAAVLQSLWRSARRQSVALQLPNTTVHHILHKDLSFHPFKVQLVQELSDSDVENIQRFCEQFREL
jgi:hypothetical protein